MFRAHQKRLCCLLVLAALGSAVHLLEFKSPTSAGTANAEVYLFCFWNVENLFDDHDNGRKAKGDAEYDPWFARDPAAFRLKLAKLSEALLRLNAGKGPDILAVVEVENTRAAEALRRALNERLADPALHYQHLLMKDLAAGRHIAPALLTRLPVHGERTRLHGRQLRILETHVDVNGHDLVVIVSHWTSRTTDKQGDSRAKYGDQIHGIFRAMYTSNPAVDFLVCGDFNDSPSDDSVTRHLQALSAPELVGKTEPGPWLLNLMAERETAKGFGTHYYSGRWYTFDQIALSPGLWGDPAGWSCDRASVQVISSLVRPGDKQRRPWRFGNEHEKLPRGYSDHFPVTVQLKVQRPAHGVPVAPR